MHVLLIFNFAHLLFISLTPYSASLIGHYEETASPRSSFPRTLGLASLSMIVLAQYVLAKKEWRTNETGGTW